jgi:fructose-bisphosphate aldolase, class II
MLVRQPREFIRRVRADRYALPAFDVCNLELAKAVLEAAAEVRAPVILATYTGDISHAGLKPLAGMIKALADDAPVPVLLHLDHGTGFDLAVQCLALGYSSVMFDGSHLALGDNIRESRTIASAAHAVGAAMEGEVGSFGGDQGAVVFTEPEEAADMFERGDVDMLAVSVGSVHGQKSRLDLDRLERIAGRAHGPLVLHGGSGIHPDDVRRAIEIGVVKLNIGYALFTAWMEGLREGLAASSSHYEVLKQGMARARDEARRRLVLTGAAGKAERRGV